MDTRELRTRRDALVATAKNILDKAQNENRDLSQVERKDFDTVQLKIEGLKGTLDRAHQLNELTADMERTHTQGVPLNAAQAPLMFGKVRAYRPDERIADAY